MLQNFRARRMRAPRARQLPGPAAALVAVAALLSEGPLASERAVAAPPAAIRDAPRPASAPAQAALELDDPVEPLVPRKARTEEETDRVIAEGYYTAARVADQKQDSAAALRLYERAYRYDPMSVSALREIVPLAFAQERTAEALRYALLVVDSEKMDAPTLHRLAGAMSESGADDRALQLYERAAKLEPQERHTPIQALQWKEMGRLYFIAKRYEPAAECFAKLSQALNHPDEYKLDDALRRRLLGSSDITYQLFGETFLEAGRLDDASAAFEKANILLPSEGVLAYHQARIAEKRGNPQLALERLQIYFDKHLNSQGPGPYELLARLLKATNQADQLEPRLERALADDPQNTPLLYYTAKHFLETERWDKSEPLYRRLAEQNRQRLPTEVVEGLLAIYRHQANASRLLDVLADTVKRGGSLQPVEDQAKQIAADGDLLKALAREAEREANQTDSPHGYAQPLAVAMLALEAKDFKTAGEFFEAAIKAEPEKKGDILQFWGLGLLMSDRAADAARVLQRGVDQHAGGADNPAFEFFLAGALEIDGRTDEALRYARLAAQAKPDNPRFALRPPWVLYHAKRYDAARAEYQAALKKFDATYDSEDVREAMRDARSALSNIEVMQHNLPAAEEWLEQILDEFPENTGALNDLGYLWADQNRHLERALRMIRAALKDDPKNLAYLDSLGWALFRLGRYAEAVEPLKAATGDPKTDPVVYEHLADAQEKSGDLAGALATWRLALAGFERDNETDKARGVREKIARVEAAVKAAAKPAGGKSGDAQPGGPAADVDASEPLKLDAAAKP